MMPGRSLPVAVALSVLAVGPLLAASAGRLSPKDIQATFFNGEPFTAATPANVKYKMVFTPDGKMTREPLDKEGTKYEGTWKLSKDGFCSTWQGSKQHCYRVTSSGENKWAVVVSTQAVAYWSK